MNWHELVTFVSQELWYLLFSTALTPTGALVEKMQFFLSGDQVHDKWVMHSAQHLEDKSNY